MPCPVSKCPYLVVTTTCHSIGMPSKCYKALAKELRLAKKLLAQSGNVRRFHAQWLYHHDDYQKWQKNVLKLGVKSVGRH